jgi:hypothetical protein
VEEQAHDESEEEVEGVKKDMVVLVDEQYVYLSAYVRMGWDTYRTVVNA